MLGVFHDLRFRDLQFQRTGFKIGLCKYAAHLRGESRMSKLLGREVHTYRKREIDLTTPFGDLPARPFKYPASDRDDKARLFRDVDKTEWRQKSATRMMPPHERLELPNRPSFQLDDRLIENFQLVSLDRSTKIDLELMRRHLVGVNRRVENLVTG